VSATAKKIVDRTMSREKTLGLSWGLESTHLAFSLPRRLMRDFRTVVLSTSLAMGDAGDELAPGRSIAGEFISHQLMRDILQPFQRLAQEACRSVFVPPFLHQDIQDLAILINRAPQIVALSINCDKHLVDVPHVAQLPLAMS
jgi:hypothetical protein